MYLNKWHTTLVMLLYIQTSPVVLAKDCPISAKSPIDYQDRGDRCEGILPKPVTSFSIELLSAVAYREAVNSLPDYFKLKFYLPKTDKIYLTVRELEPNTYYNLDVKPNQPWQQGINHYQWPTKDVIQQPALRELEINHLAVLARLEGNEPTKREQVAPVIFYYKEPPTMISGYVFSFETNGDAELTYHVFQGRTEVFTQKLGIQEGGKPFDVRWSNPSAKEGFYELVVEGHLVRTLGAIHQSVRFYHQSKIG